MTKDELFNLEVTEENVDEVWENFLKTIDELFKKNDWYDPNLVRSKFNRLKNEILFYYDFNYTGNEEKKKEALIDFEKKCIVSLKYNQDSIGETYKIIKKSPIFEEIKMSKKANKQKNTSSSSKTSIKLNSYFWLGLILTFLVVIAGIIAYFIIKKNITEEDKKSYFNGALIGFVLFVFVSGILIAL